MELFSNRELKVQDIPLIVGYWQSLAPDDITRMYIDAAKLHSSDEMEARLLKVLETPPAERQADPLLWEVNQKTVGFTNLNNIERGEQASIHLHMFNAQNRGKGYGRRLFMLSVQKYLRRHQLKKVICEPAATNAGPNGLMRALGFPIERTYLTKTPSAICFEHEVNRYEIDQVLADGVMKQLELNT
jgi:RimJ/RimL family protein N-acetyltransferase